MELFDYIIMAVGGLLIAIGLFLFISGKKESAKSNQVEGFGIKLNVSNPSIILIVLGIGLLLVPRLLPTNSVESTTDLNQTTAARSTISPQIQAESANTGLVAESFEEPAVIPVPKPPPSIFLPIGTWQLSGYELDSVDYSGNYQGSINFVGQSSTTTAWGSNFMIVDVWGNVANYQYEGMISGSGTGYYISITASNDPSFFAEGAIPLDLKLENGGVLHMSYVSNGTNILMHWFR